MANAFRRYYKWFVVSAAFGGLAVIGAPVWAAVFASSADKPISQSPMHLQALPVSPINGAATPDHAATPGHVATLDIAPYEALQAARGLRLADVPLGGGRRVELNLRRMDIFAPDGRVVLGTPDGDVQLERPAVALFHGEAAGDPASKAFLSVSPFGVYGFVESGGDGLEARATYVISTGPAGERREPMIYDLASLPPGVLDPTKFRCGADDFPPFWTPPPTDGNEEGGIAATPPCRIAQIAVDTDYEFTNNLFGGDQNAASAYAATLLGAVSAIYIRDFNTRLQISYLRLWPADIDPWDQTDMGAQLSQFQGYWNANMGGVHRHLAHFLSGRCLGGGVAWVGVVCNGGYGYALSSCLGGYFPQPIQNNHGANWDLMVVAHEIGHNFGAPHTHDMNPQIDNCANGDCSAVPNGTIMSYCHLCPGGLAAVRMEMHPRTINEAILPYLASTCSLTGAPFDGYALNFDGSNDSVTIPGFGLIAPTTEVTVEFWQYADDAWTRSAFGLSMDSNTNRFQAHAPWSNGVVYWDFGNINGGQGRLFYTPPQPAAGSWQHFAFVASQSGNHMRIYRNGVLEAQKAGMWPFARGNFDLKLGALGSGNFFNGRLAEFRVWSVARSAADIAANYTKSLTGNEPGLLGYWRLNEGTGAVAHDLAPAGGVNDGAINGATWTPLDNCVGDTGSCCFYDGTCLTVTRDACAMFGGTYLGDGTGCETTGCPPPGACCLPAGDGACDVLFEVDCLARGGTFMGADTSCDEFGPLNGHALGFDGVNDYVQLLNPADLNFSGAITIEAWVRPEATDGIRNIVMHGFRNNPNAMCGLRINNGAYEILSWNSAYHRAAAPVPAGDVGQWVHLAGTHDGTAWRLYRNGVLVGETLDSFGAMAMSSSWAIGARGTGTEHFFKGDIDEVRVWNVARSGAQINGYKRRLLKGNEPGLVGYWRLDENAGNFAEDLTGGSHGTVFGATRFETRQCRDLETVGPQP